MGSKKKVDEWFYSIRDAMERQVPIENTTGDETSARPETYVGERKVKVLVYLIKETREDAEPPHTLSKVEFRVECEDPRFAFEGPDISALKEAAGAAIDKKFEIKWVEHYLVTIQPVRIYQGEGEGLELNFDTVWRGETWEGKALLKEWDRYRRGEPWHIRPWPGRFTTKGGKVIACVPHDEMTEVALKEFAARIKQMRERLIDFIKPERIMHTLQNLSGLKLLETPESLETPDRAQPEKPA